MMQEEVYEASEIIEETPIIEESGDEIIEVEIFEAFQAPTADDSFNHALLTNREIHDAHPITAITGLREELDSIEALQTVYSDKKGNADYYEWADGLAIADAGYFVTLNNDARITICTGDDIFGVVVDGAAFVGGQDDVVRDARYGLVATTGAVNVRCELDVVEGDYVISNAYGTATKSTSECGYKVVALHNINGVPHATINLNISADQVHLMGAELQKLDSRMGAAETNIVSAINVANEAHKQASEAATSSSVSEEAVKKALESILKSEENIKEFGQTVGSASATSAQAKAIAESAVVSADSMKTEAMDRANEAWAKADEVQKEAYSLCAKIDTYSVGEYSQAYGLTLEQAQSILEPGIIYAPTKHPRVETYHTEIYEYTNCVEPWIETDRDESKVYYDESTKQYWYYHSDWVSSSEMPKYERIFTPEYLYQWGYLPAIQRYGWITIDKNHQLVNYESSVEVNTAHKAVYFFSKEIKVAEGSNFGYWYTDGEQIEDSEGNIGVYMPYTLYKWEYDHWVAVATLKGNVSNRMVSEIYQTTNEITLGVTNARGCIASLRTSLSDTESKVQDMTMWITGSDENGNALSYNLATIDRSANKDGSSIALAVADVNGNKVINGASITLNQDGSDSSVYIDASHIVLDGKTTFTSDDNGETRIDGGYIATNTITADKIEVKDLKAFGATIGGFTITDKSIQNGKTSFNDTSDGVYIGTDGIGLGNGKFYVTSAGTLRSEFGYIGNWAISKDEIYSGTSGLSANSNNSYMKDSLVTSEATSAVRFYCGHSNRVDGNFVVLDDGSLYAGAVKLGTGTFGSDQSVFLSTTNMSGTLGSSTSGLNETQTNWRLTVGENFGVTSDGSLYANKGIFAGELSSVTGSFGDCTIGGKLTFGGDASYYINTNGDNTNNYICLPQFTIGKSRIKLGDWYVVSGNLVSTENLDNTPEAVKLTPGTLYTKTYDSSDGVTEEYSIPWVDVALSAKRVRENWSKLYSMMEGATNGATNGATGYMTFRSNGNSAEVYYQRFISGTFVSAGTLTVDEFTELMNKNEILWNIICN